jgi:hypothetical protein
MRESPSFVLATFQLIAKLESRHERTSPTRRRPAASFSSRKSLPGLTEAPFFGVVLEPHSSNKLFTLLSWKVQCGRLTYRLPSLLRLGCGRTANLAKARTFHERRISPKVPGRRGRLTWSCLTRLGRGGSQFERRQAHAEIELRSSRCGVCRYPYSIVNFKEE